MTLSLSPWKPDQSILNDIRSQIRSQGSALIKLKDPDAANRLCQWLKDCLPPEKYGCTIIRGSEVNIYMWHVIDQFKSI